MLDKPGLHPLMAMIVALSPGQPANVSHESRTLLVLRITYSRGRSLEWHAEITNDIPLPITNIPEGAAQVRQQTDAEAVQRKEAQTRETGWTKA